MDERVWADQPLALGESLEIEDCQVTRVATGVQSLVSGDLPAALETLAQGADLLGFGDTPGAGDHALRISRDHALLITAEPVVAKAGWHARGFAFSPAGERYACLTLTGPGAKDCLARGLISAPATGSPSAATLIAGIPALVTGQTEGLSLWVECAYLAFLSSFLKTSAAA